MGRFRNPILAGCHPDPSLCRFDGAYVLVTSSFEYLPGLPVHVSRDLVTWEQVGHVLERPSQLDLAGLPSSRGLFAPTVRAIGGVLHVVCTVVGPDDGEWPGRTGHFVVTATDARGPWTDPVWIEGVGGIDPSLTADGDRLWLTTTQPADPPGWPAQTEVRLVELDPATFQPVSDPTVIWNGALRGAIWAEGPHILPRPDGGWMLLAAEGGTAENHAVSVAYSDELTGPYAGDPGNPRLTHRALGARAEFADVGHADLVQHDDGSWWATVLATRPVEGRAGLLGRETCLVPVEWEQGRPVFAPRTGRVESVVEGPSASRSWTPPPVVDEGFGGSELGREWNGVGRHPVEFAELLDGVDGVGGVGGVGGGVRLHGGGEPSSLEPQSFLGRRLPAQLADVSVAISVASGSTGRGGLLLRTAEHTHLEVGVDGQGLVRCVLVVGGNVEAVGESRASAGHPVPLGLEIDGLRGRVLVDGRLLAEVDLSGLAPDPSSGFVGVWVGPFSAGPDSAGPDSAGPGEHRVDATDFRLRIRAEELS